MTRFAVITFNEVPTESLTFKYEVLGELALINHRQYCEQHGYDFIDQVKIDHSRPFCWSKIPAIYTALERYPWVLWADSDTLVCNMDVCLEDLCDERSDLIVQYQEHWWELIGLENGTERFPINSGVFMMKSSPWSLQFLKDTYTQEQFVTKSDIWDGIGEQEAMNHLIRANPDYRLHIKYIKGLQTSPKLYTKNDFMVHCYGDNARHWVPIETCVGVLERWTHAITRKQSLPDDLVKFHWCCIQHKDPHRISVKRELHNFLYTVEDVCG